MIPTRPLGMMAVGVSLALHAALAAVLFGRVLPAPPASSSPPLSLSVAPRPVWEADPIEAPAHEVARSSPEAASEVPPARETLAEAQPREAVAAPDASLVPLPAATIGQGGLPALKDVGPTTDSKASEAREAIAMAPQAGPGSVRPTPPASTDGVATSVTPDEARMSRPEDESPPPSVSPAATTGEATLLHAEGGREASASPAPTADVVVPAPALSSPVEGPTTPSLAATPEAGIPPTIGPTGTADEVDTAVAPQVGRPAALVPPISSAAIAPEARVSPPETPSSVASGRTLTPLPGAARETVLAPPAALPTSDALIPTLSQAATAGEATPLQAERDREASASLAPTANVVPAPALASPVEGTTTPALAMPPEAGIPPAPGPTGTANEVPTGVHATMPQEMAALELGADAVRVRDFVRHYDGGPCFFASVTKTADADVRIDSFSTAIEPVMSFHSAFMGAMGLEPDVTGQRIWKAQCPAVEFLRQTQGQGLPLTIDLDRRDLRSGEVMSGTIRGAVGRPVTLLLVSETGAVEDLSASLTDRGADKTFAAPLHHEGTGGPFPQMLVAVMEGGRRLGTAIEPMPIDRIRAALAEPTVPVPADLSATGKLVLLRGN